MAAQFGTVESRPHIEIIENPNGSNKQPKLMAFRGLMFKNIDIKWYQKVAQ